MNHALVIFAHGRGFVLCYEVEESIRQCINDMSGSDTFDTEKCSVDFENPGDGVFIVDVGLIDDGPGDWPGSREVAIQFSNACKATKNQWDMHCDGLWPWETGKT